MSIERSFDVEMSIKIAKNFIKNSDIDYDIIEFGDKYKSYSVVFDKNDYSGQKIIGNGKGIGRQAEASAFFEAIEHYIFDKMYLEKNGYNKNIKEMHISNEIKNMHYIIELLDDKFDSISFDCLKFDEYLGNDTIFFPKFLIYPYNNLPDNLPEKVLMYSSNNGTAVGVNYDDALLHSVLEVVERDALSIHYLKYFVGKKTETLYYVDDSDLTEKNRDILLELQKEFSNVKLINITTENNIPSVLCIGYLKDYRYPFVGSGSSLSKDYAIERALTEALQSLHLFADDIYMEDLMNENILSRFPNLVKCLKLEYNIKRESYKPLPDYDILNVTVTEQLKDLKNKIKRTGYNIYHTKIFESDDIYCCRALIFGYEQFHLVRNGKIIMPSLRGVKYLKGESCDCNN